MTTTETTSFQVGETYATRSASNWDCIYSWTVIKRTAKFVTLQEDSGRVNRVGVRTWNGVEMCRPFGAYSMAPSIRADRPGLPF